MIKIKRCERPVVAAGLFFFLCLGLALSLAAETVVFRSGEKVEGRMLDMTSDSITIEVFGVPKIYRLEEVKSIDGRDFAMPAPLAADSQPVTVAAQDNFSYSQESLEVKAAAEADIQPPDNKKLSKKQRREKAAAIEKIKEKTPDQALAYFEIGYIHRSLGENEQALENYKKALKLDPDLGQKFFNQALDDFYLNRHNTARDKFLRARELFAVQEDTRMTRLVNQQIRELYNNPEDDFF